MTTNVLIGISAGLGTLVVLLLILLVVRRRGDSSAPPRKNPPVAGRRAGSRGGRRASRAQPRSRSARWLSCRRRRCPKAPRLTLVPFSPSLHYLQIRKKTVPRLAQNAQKRGTSFA